MKRIYFIFFVILTSITFIVGGFYLTGIQRSYVSNVSGDITINFSIEADDSPYVISNIISSRSEYSISSFITDANVSLFIGDVTRHGKVSFTLTGDSGTSDSYIVDVIPNDSIIDSQRLLENIGVSISDFSNGGFDISISDSDTLDNSLINLNKNISTDLVSYDGEFVFTLSSSNIYQFSSNFDEITDYSYTLPNGLFFNNITDFKTLNGELYFRYNNGSVYRGIRSGSTFTFSIIPGTFSDLGLVNSGIESSSFIQGISNIRDFQKVGNFLYILTDTYFELLYQDSSTLSDSISLYNIPHPGIYSSFILNNGVSLFNSSGDVYFINNDYFLYFLKDNGTNTIDITSGTGFTQYNPLLKTQNQLIGSTTSVITKSPEQSIITPTSAVNGSLPIYKNEFLQLNFDSSEFIPIELTKSLQVDKFSSKYGEIIGSTNPVSFSVPLIGYGVSFSSSPTPKNPGLNVGLSDIKIRSFPVPEGDIYIHIKAYDYGLNTSQEIIKGPIRVISNGPKIGEPYLSTNNLTILGGGELEFIINSDKELSVLDIQTTDDLGNIDNFSLSNIEYIESDSGFIYLLPYSLRSGVNKVSFNIEARDTFLGVSSNYYEYNINSGWFQVLGITQTNTGLGSSLSQNQKDRGFVFGVDSQTEVGEEINTDFKFNSDKTVFRKIPTSSSGGITQINHILLKNDFPEFNGKIRKDIDDEFFYFNGNTLTPRENIRLLNGYYYVYTGDLLLNQFIFSGDGILIVEGNIDISGDIIKELSTQTAKYKNNMGIYSLGNINIYSNVAKIDSFLFSNQTLSTLSISYDTELLASGEQENIFKNTDGFAYYDFTRDGRADVITFENLFNGKNRYHLYALGPNNNYSEYKLTPESGLIGDFIQYGNNSGNFINGNEVNDIILVDTDLGNSVYSIDLDLQGLTIK